MRKIKEIEAEVRELADKEGYLLNPDREILEGIIEGIAVNEEKLGYWNCPCRRASGDRMQDQDIICPCQYRDPDLAEYGRCYCALYVTQEYVDQGSSPEPIPERREKEIKSGSKDSEAHNEIPEDQGENKIKTWRCQVCGYLCARPEAPPVCPICRAKKERFEEYRI
ncbi:MAG: ferredoxin-thioredoxin reductase catalytic domain-containing protein [Candidatus Edwardsbacteria bacterium]|nr:ferredoxin-thioredoxin reductase catalytic domain-containing protein [Candidatus Edwardsbacteria bacterium]